MAVKISRRLELGIKDNYLTEIDGWLIIRLSRDEIEEIDEYVPDGLIELIGILDEGVEDAKFRINVESSCRHNLERGHLETIRDRRIGHRLGVVGRDNGLIEEDRLSSRVMIWSDEDILLEDLERGIDYILPNERGGGYIIKLKSKR
jgi:hypothetical protein